MFQLGGTGQYSWFFGLVDFSGGSFFVGPFLLGSQVTDFLVLVVDGGFTSVDWLPLFLDCFYVAAFAQQDGVARTETFFALRLGLGLLSRGFLEEFLFLVGRATNCLFDAIESAAVDVEDGFVLFAYFFVDESAVFLERETIVVVDCDANGTFCDGQFAL